MSRRVSIAVLLLLAATAFWARCTSWRSVFPPSGETELVPTDSHFYVRFALLQLHALPSLTTFDPYINHPHGAQLYVPLPHALVVAGFIALFGEPRAELAAAWVGPVVGTLEWLLVALLALRVLGRGRGLVLAALWALASAIAEVAALGNADHHVHEPMFAAAILLATLQVTLQPERRGWAMGAGLLLGLARWLTPTGFLFPPVAALALMGAALLARERAGLIPRAALWMGGTSAGVLLLGAALFGRPGALDYEQFSLFHPLLSVCAFAGAAAVAWLRTRSWSPAAIGFALAGLAAAPLLAQLIRAGGHLGRSDPLLSLVYESEPLWSDLDWALELLGPFLLALIPACVGLGLLLRQRPRQDRPALEAAVVLAFTVPLAAAGILQARFSPLLAAMAAAACVVGLPRLVPRAGPARLAVLSLGAVLTLPLLLALVPRPFRPAPRDLLLARPTLRWMSTHLPPASADPFSGAQRPTYGVITTHLLGHVVPLWAQRPTVATLLSQDPAFVAANRRAARVLAGEDDQAAYQAARETGAGYVVATPSDRILGIGPPSERSLLLHLLDHAGMEQPQREASAHFRLIHDSEEQRLRPQGGSAARVFQVVPGALLTGRTAPSARVIASLVLHTDRGERLEYVRRVGAGSDGSFSLRVAYPGEYQVTVAGQVTRVLVAESQVLGGASQPVIAD
ncbi:MAG: peptide transporter [Myxococcota bacterium]|nr:peptide transporter [Myxococcota bacterium]